jgi:hypothetical protein
LPTKGPLALQALDMAAQPAPGTHDRAVLLNQYRLDPYGASDGGDLSFGLDPPSRPWKKVALAVMLLVIGSVMLFTGVGLFVSGMNNGEWGKGMQPG